jgi:hypothetical protein
MIYAPSLQLFDGSNTNAEIIIEHIPELGGKNLYVCIPIIQSTDTSEASNILTPIITMAASKAPTSGSEANMNLTNFTLNSIVHVKPFYSYQGDFFGSNSDFIVYGRNYAIPMSKKTCDILKKIIKPTSAKMTGGSLFINEKGPNTNLSKEGIYISCQPVNKSGQVISAEVIKSETSQSSIMDFGSGDSYKIMVQILIGLIFFGILFFLLNYGYTYFTKAKLPDFSRFSFTSKT